MLCLLQPVCYSLLPGSPAQCRLSNVFPFLLLIPFHSCLSPPTVAFSKCSFSLPPLPLVHCTRNPKSQLEMVIEHLVGRQGQPRGAQVHAMQPNDQKGWSQNPPLPQPHLRAGSGGGGLLLAVSVYLGSLKVSSFFPLCLCLQLLHLSKFSLAEALDPAALMSLLCFSLHYMHLFKKLMYVDIYARFVFLGTN